MYRVICHSKDYKRYAAWVAGLFILVSCAQPSTKPASGVSSRAQNPVESSASAARGDGESVTGVEPATGVVGDTAVSGDGVDAGRVVASEGVDSKSLTGEIQPSEAEAAGSSLDQEPSPVKKKKKRRKKRPKVSVGDSSEEALESHAPTSEKVAGVTPAGGAGPSGVDSNAIETARKIASKLDLSYVTIEKLQPVESFVVIVSPRRDVASEPASEPKLEVWLDDGFAVSPNKLLRQADISEVPPLAFRRKGAVLNRYYFARVHDTADSLAMILYNDPKRARDLTRWNRGVWDPGRALFYASPIDPEDRKMVSFYEERGLVAETITMVRGECLRPLALRLYDSQLSWREIVAVNGFDDRDLCTPGAKLKAYPRDLLGAVSKLSPLRVPTVDPGITQSTEPHDGEGGTLADDPPVSDGSSSEILPESGSVERGVASQSAPPVAEGVAESSQALVPEVAPAEGGSAAVASEKLSESGSVEPGVASQSAPPVAEGVAESSQALVPEVAPAEGGSAAVASEKLSESGSVERGVASQSAPPAVEPLAESSQAIVPQAADEKLSLPNEPIPLPAFQPDSSVMKKAPSVEPDRPASAATPEP